MHRGHFNEYESSNAQLTQRSNKAFLLVPLLLGLSYSIYTVSLRAKIGSTMGTNYSFMVLITSMETIPGVFSVVMGYYSDKFGGRLSIYFGFAASILLILFPFLPMELIPLLVFSFVTMYMIYTPYIYGIILRKAMGSGKKLSMLLMMFSIGWTCGGLFPAFLSLVGKGDMGFFIASFLMMLSAWILVGIYGGNSFHEASKFSIGDFRNALSTAWWTAIGLILWSSGYSMLSGVFSLKLYNSVGSQFEYGFYFTFITGMASIIIRPYAGMLVDRISPLKMITASTMAYLLLSLILLRAPPALIIILWILPIYPFFDTSSYSLLSRIMTIQLQSTAAGIMSTSLSIGGGLNLAMYYMLRNQSYSTILLVDSVIFALSIAWFMIAPRKFSK
ncbi:MAG: MFS transporter [Fervidicoccaceae archaeon]